MARTWAPALEGLGGRGRAQAGCELGTAPPGGCGESSRDQSWTRPQNRQGASGGGMGVGLAL